MTWQLDPTHAHVQFSARHMMVATVKGQFKNFTAEAEIDPSDLSKSKVKASAEVASISTGVEQRDGHLKSADFFDAENHPTLTLVSTAVRAKGEDLEVVADLTIRGVTKSVTFKGEVFGPAKDPWGNQRIGVNLHGEVLREDFGLLWNQALETGGVVVSNKVKIEIDAEFTSK